MVEENHYGFKRTDTMNVMSVTKSVTAILLGIAIDKGYIKRIADTKNNRLVRITKLTSKGQKTLEKIKIAKLGDSNELKVGNDIIAIGNALGYGQSVTTGVISAVNRVIDLDDSKQGTFIQTNAEINPGNSGGALLNQTAYDGYWYPYVSCIPTHTLTYNCNGNGNGSSITYQESDLVTTLMPVPAGCSIPSGSEFVGWYCAYGKSTTASVVSGEPPVEVWDQFVCFGAVCSFYIQESTICKAMWRSTEYCANGGTPVDYVLDQPKDTELANMMLNESVSVSSSVCNGVSCDVFSWGSATGCQGSRSAHDESYSLRYGLSLSF